MGRRRRQVFLLVLTLASCKTATVGEPSPPPPSPAPEPPVEAEPTPIEGNPWVGKWQSSACGDRAYPRWLTVEADGELTVQERLSPCAPDEDCEDPGVVTWLGTWTKTDGGITIEMVDYEPDPKTTPPPSKLSWEEERLVEQPGEAPCPYEPR